MTELQDDVSSAIWDYFERCANLMQTHREDPKKMSIRHLKMCDYNKKSTKNGYIKTVEAVRDMPPLCIDFFENHFKRDVKQAYNFFNPHNKTKSLDAFVKNYLASLGRFKVDDIIGEGLMSHDIAWKSLPWHNEQEAKVY